MLKNESKRAVIYKRSSTNSEQDLDKQLLECRKYIERENLEEVEIYSDLGTKQNLERLIEDSKLGEFDCVVLYSLDRLSRRVVDILNIIKIFQNNNVTLRTIREDINTFDKDSGMNYLINISASIAQFEQDIIKERNLQKV